MWLDMVLKEALITGLSETRGVRTGAKVATSGCNVISIPQPVSVELQWSLPTPLKADQTPQIQAQLLQVRWNPHLYVMNITPVPPLKLAAVSSNSQICALNGDAAHLKAPPAVMTITAAAPMTTPSVTSVLEPARRYLPSTSIYYVYVIENLKLQKSKRPRTYKMS